jgi:hypothetical protein
VLLTHESSQAPEEYLAHAADVQSIKLAFESKDIAAAERWLDSCAEQLPSETERRLRFELAKMRFLSLVEVMNAAHLCNMLTGLLQRA